MSENGWEKLGNKVSEGPASAGCIAVIFVTLFLGFCVVLSVGGWVGNWFKGAADRVLSPDAAISNYEWYEQQARDIKTAAGQVKDGEDALERYKKDNGPANEWRFDQREEYSRLNTNLQGLKSYKRRLVQDYNARSSMFTRTMWKHPSLPQTIEE